MKFSRLMIAAACLASLSTVHAQSGSVRLSAAANQPQAQQQGGVQPVAAPVIAPAPQRGLSAPPAVNTPSANGPMPTPLPGGAMSAPVNLKQEAIDRIAPLTPREIIELRGELDKRTAAMSQPLNVVAKPVRRLLSLDLSPGAAPEIIRSSFGQGTVVTFLDAAGRPWPVETAENFNPRGFDIALMGTNGVSVAVKSESARAGNIAVKLDGLVTPITFAVAIGQNEVDYSVEMQLAKYLPGAPAPVGSVERLPALGAPDLLNYLLGTPPKDAKPLEVNASNVKAWQISSEMMIIRTDAVLASPRYSRRQSSATGVTVYEVPLMSRLTLASQGQMQSVMVAGFTATKEQK